MESELDQPNTECESNGEESLLEEVIITSCEHCASAALIKDYVSTYRASNKAGKQSSELTVLGSCLAVAQHTLCGFYLSLYRQFRLHRNDRESILNHEDQLIALQLILAAKNKREHGEFDIAVSSVLEMLQHLMEYRLFKSNDNSTAEVSKDIEEVLCSYETFKRDCNMIDWLDVYLTVKKKSSEKEELANSLRGSNFLIVNPNSNDRFEVEMIHFLCSPDKRVKKATMALSLDESFSHQVDLPTSASIAVEDFSFDDLKTLPVCVCDEHQQKKSSVSESYIEQIILGYLELLANSRNELSLARVINVPDRGIDHSAFTDIKHAAQTSGLPMYQTITSYVMRLRLGGKGYAAPSNSQLNKHTKGLSDFTDVMHSLQTRIEENTDPMVALTKVIGCLSSKTSKLLSRQIIDTVAERILETIQKTIEHLSISSAGTPSRSASDGGTSLGRRTLRVIRAVLDQYSARSASCTGTDVLSDLYTSQGTPICLPSLLSKFRSPNEELNSETVKPLIQRLNLQDVDIPKTKKRVSDGRVRSGFTWASDDSNSMHSSADVMDYIRSSTIVHPAAAPAVQQQRKVSAKRSLPLSPGKENIYPHSEFSSVDGSAAKSARKENSSSILGDASNILGDSNSKKADNLEKDKKGTAASKEKGSKGGPRKSTTNKKAVKPLIAGQTKLSSFFK